MADRRRINGPPGGTAPPVFASAFDSSVLASQRPRRSREANQLRKIFLRTGLTPSASGSAYLELSPEPTSSSSVLLTSTTSSLKLTATVHGPRPLPRSAPFTPNLLLTCTLNFAPFASRSHRRGFVRDSAERDLGVHLETALRGVIIGERWPKSGVEVCVTVLEGEEDGWWGDNGSQSGGGHGAMTVLAGAITAASAALVDAGIDCVDLVSGGVAALVETEGASQAEGRQTQVVLDPCPAEHKNILSACVVGYLASRDELTEIWLKGTSASSNSTGEDSLIDRAIEAAVASRTVLAAAVLEATEARLLGAQQEDSAANGSVNGAIHNGVSRPEQDVEMAAA